MRNQPGRFETLDAMRGVAALVVALYHFQYTLPWRVRDYCFQSGYLAVDLFFVLSGFVVALSYDGKLEGGMTVRKFAEVRMVRLLPMVWIGVTIGGIYHLLGPSFSTAEVTALVACNAFLLPYLGHGGLALFSANSSAWSLFFEWVANLFYVLVWRWLSSAVLIVIILLSAAGLLATVGTFGNLNVGHALSNALGGLARVGFSFFLGIFLWRMRERWAPVTPRLPAPLVLAAVALFLFPQLTGDVRAVYDLAFALILSPLLVILGSSTEPVGRGVRIAEWLAALSYPLYAIHRPLQQLTERLASMAGVSTRIAAIVALISIVPLSLLLAKYYDEPVRAWLRRRPSKLAVDRNFDLS